jgi:hypothetical protein
MKSILAQKATLSFYTINLIKMSAQSNNSENKKMSDNQPILCIPGVFANIKEERIRRVFGDLNLGQVDRVDIVAPKKPVGAEEKENKFNRVFIHLIWNDTPSSVACRKKLLEGKDVKIIYDEPWFWRVSAYRPPALKPRFESQSKPRTFQPKKATLELDFEPAEVKYSGIIAPGLNIIAPALNNIAPALSIIIPVENKKEPKSPICPPPIQKQYDELGEEIKPLNYGNVPPAPKRKTKIIVEETTTVDEEK